MDESIEWEDRSWDDCIANWRRLFLHVEQMDKNYWWWSISSNLEQLDCSDNYDNRVTKKKAAQAAAEKAARLYFPHDQASSKR